MHGGRGSTELWESVDQYVRSESDGDSKREQCMPVILRALNEQKVDLLDIVLRLDKELRDATNPMGRRFAVRLLSECVAGATSGADGAPLRLNFKHVETLTVFFCSKLSDWQCVEGAICGLQVLLRRYAPVLRTLETSDAEGVAVEPLVTDVARKLFNEVHTPSHTQPIRKVVLEFVHLLLEEWRDEVSKLVGERCLGEGVHGTLEEERDPRNLLLSFNILRKLLADFPPECVPETVMTTIFETLTSYFPITFTPPKDDKFGITGADLRRALVRALSSTTRLAKHVIPFFVDSSMDIAGADSESTIEQALDMLGECLETFGPEIAKAHLGSVLKTARDQACRTTTSNTKDFAACVRRALTVALQGTPNGLHPSWLAREVEPMLTSLAADATMASKGDGGISSIASTGAQQLLLGAAAAHKVLLERVWSLVIPALLAPKEDVASKASSSSAAGKAAASAAVQEGFLPMLLDLVKLVEPPQPTASQRLVPRQLRPALEGSLASVLLLQPGESETAGVAFELLGRLCRLAGEDASQDAFRVLCSALFADGVGNVNTPDQIAWADAWRTELEAAPGDHPVVVALTGAICDVAARQPARASDVASTLVKAADGGIFADVPPAWLPNALPRLFAAAILGLSGQTAGTAKPEGPAALASEVLARAAAVAGMVSDASRTLSPGLSASESLFALAEALEDSGAPATATSWLANEIVSAHLTRVGLPKLCEGLSGSVDSFGATARGRVAAVRALVRALLLRLPPKESAALHRKVVDDVVSAVADDKLQDSLAPVIVLLPAVLPSADVENWAFCKRVLPTVCLCATSARHRSLEPMALEALEALVEACPATEVPELLGDIRTAFWDFLPEARKEVSSTKSVESHAACGAARCWAAVAGTLLRRGGFAQQSAAFLEALLGSLKFESPVTPFVPLAFHVLMPPRFGSVVEVAGKRNDGNASQGVAPSKLTLSPLALQQLSRTTLPLLVSLAKAPEGKPHELTKHAALDSAIALLCALPAEVACTDCEDELRWCALAGLRRLGDESAVAITPSGVGDGGAEAAVFAVQVLQLLLRACGRSAPWVEDNLNSVVLPVTVTSVRHPVPLVRLACLQVLASLVQQSLGHLMPFRKQIDKTLRRAIADRRREVRLVAVACLNAWHCGPLEDD